MWYLTMFPFGLSGGSHDTTIEDIEEEEGEDAAAVRFTEALMAPGGPGTEIQQHTRSNKIYFTSKRRFSHKNKWASFKSKIKTIGLLLG